MFTVEGYTASFVANAMNAAANFEKASGAMLNRVVEMMVAHVAANPGQANGETAAKQASKWAADKVPQLTSVGTIAGYRSWTRARSKRKAPARRYGRPLANRPSSRKPNSGAAWPSMRRQ